MSNKTLTIAERSAQVAKTKLAKKLIPIAIAILGTIITMLYVISLLYFEFGSFTVKANMGPSDDMGFILSETRDFAHKTAKLSCKANCEIRDTTYEYIKNAGFGSMDGNQSTNEYLCYTFYLKNVGQKSVIFDEQIIVEDSTQKASTGIRVMVIKKVVQEGTEVTPDSIPEKTIYQHTTRTDEFNNPIFDDPEILDVPQEAFKLETLVRYYRDECFDPGDIIKYTIVIWFDGEDPDCEDPLIGGEFKINMTFDIIGEAGMDTGEGEN